MARVPGLSKSRYQAGLQCPKRLWLRCHQPDLADPLSEGRLAIFATGHEVGALAREYFPGGVLLEEDHTQSSDALRTTARLLVEGTACLFEAAFMHEGVLVRPDVLRRTADGRWDLIEVKSTTEAKEEHITDVAIQAWVLQGAGLELNGAYIMHLNRDYAYQGGPYDLTELFVLADVTAAVHAYLPCVAGELAAMKAMVQDACPSIFVGRRCTEPYGCEFIGYCHSDLPDFPVTQIPRIKAEVLEALLHSGILSIHDVPRTYPGLTPAQQSVCEVIRSGEPRYGAGLGPKLAELNSPIHFLDFETSRPALPRFPSTRPYHLLPVQWSCHTLQADGSLEHREFLHTEATDPRLPFAESLLTDVLPDGPIVVYTAYESTVLTKLAEDLPGLSASGAVAPASVDKIDRGLEALKARLFDLHAVVRDFVEHPDFHGRTSLKYVLPALVDDVSYADLEIANGEVAMLRYQEAIRGDLTAEERQATFADLLAYCATDTLALVRVFQELSRVTTLPATQRRPA